MKFDLFDVIAAVAAILTIVIVIGGVWWWAIAGMSSEVGMALFVTGMVAFFVALMAGAWGA